MELYPFQAEGVQHLVARRSLLLADEMGLGKTVQAAVALQRLFKCGAIRRVLVVCPASLVRNWRQELLTWAGLRAVLYEGADRFGMLYGGASVLIGTYETIAGDLRRGTADGRVFHDVGLDLLILDEAQRIKSPDGLGSRVLAKLTAPRRWALTGTPMENHPRELASILRFLWPNELSTAGSFDDFGVVLALRDRTLLRRTKAQVALQLPGKTVASVHLGLTPEQAAEYGQALESLVRALIAPTTYARLSLTLLSGLQHLRRIATVSSNGESSKIDLIEAEMEEIVRQGEKAVVFSTFAKLALPRLASRLSRFGALLYVGSMTGEERNAVHQQFLGDRRASVMCASLRAAGVGLTWTVASHVYHTDLWWNPQVLKQAEDRVHRIGQANRVLIKRLVAESTIEDAVEGLLAAKQDVFDFVINEDINGLRDASRLSDLLSLVGLKSSDLSIRR